MLTLPEHHLREQYFFDEKTLHALADFAAQFERPCCLCAPMLGQELARRKKNVTILDVDNRFSNVPGFLHWDLNRPQHLSAEFDLIVCDPPFFTVSLSRLFAAIRLLCHFDLRRPILISYPLRRQKALRRAFAPFKLKPTGWRPGYLTVEKCEKNEIEFFANVEGERLETK